MAWAEVWRLYAWGCVTHQVPENDNYSNTNHHTKHTNKHDNDAANANNNNNNKTQ